MPVNGSWIWPSPDKKVLDNSRDTQIDFARPRMNSRAAAVPGWFFTTRRYPGTRTKTNHCKCALY